MSNWRNEPEISRMVTEREEEYTLYIYKIDASCRSKQIPDYIYNTIIQFSSNQMKYSTQQSFSESLYYK